MDIRIQTSLFGHHKTKRLIRLSGGIEAVYSLIQLWSFAGEHRSKGILSGLDNIDIAEVSGWPGDPTEFVNLLVDCRFLDRGDSITIHNWAKRQPWANKQKERSEQGKKAANARWMKRGYADSNADGMQGASPGDAKGNAPSPKPTPSPSPNPKPKTKNSTPPCPYQKIMELFNELCPSLRNVKSIEDDRQVRVRRIWKKKPDIEWWKQYFITIELSDFLSGRAPKTVGHETWECGFDFIITPRYLTKIVEGFYENKGKTEQLTAKQMREREACRTAAKS